MKSSLDMPAVRYHTEYMWLLCDTLMRHLSHPHYHTLTPALFSPWCRHPYLIPHKEDTRGDSCVQTPLHVVLAACKVCSCSDLHTEVPGPLAAPRLHGTDRSACNKGRTHTKSNHEARCSRKRKVIIKSLMTSAAGRDDTEHQAPERLGSC